MFLKKKEREAIKLAKKIKNRLRTQEVLELDEYEEVLVSRFVVAGSKYDFAFELVICGGEENLEIRLIKYTSTKTDDLKETLKTRKEFDYGFTDKSLHDIAREFLVLKDSYRSKELS